MMLGTQFKIGENVMAITPAFNEKFQSLIYAEEGSYYSTGTSTQIIKEMCKLYRSTYEGRKVCVVNVFEYKRKTPIPVSPENFLYAFPTCSPRRYDCVWIFIHHIAHLDKHEKDGNITRITFRNGQVLDVATPNSIIYTQIERTLACTARFSLQDYISPMLTRQYKSKYSYEQQTSSMNSSMTYTAETKEKYNNIKKKRK